MELIEPTLITLGWLPASKAAKALRPRGGTFTAGSRATTRITALFWTT